MEGPRQLGLRAHPELAVDPGQVVLDGLRAEVRRSCDLAGGRPGRGQLRHVLLLACQWEGPSGSVHGVAEALEQGPGVVPRHRPELRAREGQVRRPALAFPDSADDPVRDRGIHHVHLVVDDPHEAGRDRFGQGLPVPAEEGQGGLEPGLREGRFERREQHGDVRVGIHGASAVRAGIRPVTRIGGRRRARDIPESPRRQTP